MSIVCSRCTAIIRSNSYKIQCNKCKSWCHRDCAKLTTEELQLFAKDINSEHGKKWLCETCKITSPIRQKEEAKNAMVSKETEIVTQENNYLKRLLKELEEKNLLLQQNKALLEQKVLDLENKLQEVTVTKNNTKNRNLNRNQYATESGNTESNSDNIQQKMSQTELFQSVQNKGYTPKGNSKPSYQQVLLSNNVRTGESPVHPSVSHNKQINRRKYINIGTADTDNTEIDFSGKDNKNKKAWFFLSRVKDHVTEEQIKNYIKQKTEITDEQEIVVKHYKTKYDEVRKDCRCFQVGVRFDLKERLYDNNFWPNKVAFRRFDFKVNVTRQPEDANQVF